MRINLIGLNQLYLFPLVDYTWLGKCIQPVVLLQTDIRFSNTGANCIGLVNPTNISALYDLEIEVVVTRDACQAVRSNMVLSS